MTCRMACRWKRHRFRGQSGSRLRSGRDANSVRHCIRSIFSRIRSAEQHPCLKQCDFERRERFFGRHQCAGIVTDDRTNEGTFSKILRDHGGSVISAQRQTSPRIEDEASVILLLRFRMTFVASFFEYRQNLRLEKAARVVFGRRKIFSDRCGDEPTGEERGENELHRILITPRYRRPARRILLL